ncbi:hypothetical protein C8F04DRAFT_980139 [Mycena alexandri]|uniref:CxC1-like cysteine cluster associated with KDZ transposases domain-containing protein n=1 Tax=Mycena alexandri TaxID=1745969 RepID=A0AAD6RY97_9AGAR|nr:hypothetical protein C8F04DRAFT_980139 [Mycena alexandri]
MVSRGFVPCAPYKATVAFSIRLLEVFRIAHLRTPQLSIHAWIKTIADIHGLPFKPYRAQQFSTAYDLYLAILRRVKLRVQRVLGRNGRKWRMENCCPACMLKVEDEEELTFSILVTMDGNDSLKRVFRRESPDYDNEGNPLPGVSKERFDPRVADAGGDYFLPREQVNLWDKEQMKARAEASEDKSPCEERWKNLSEDSAKKMWAIYDETGIFICLCRHGFVLMVADMVRSGELSKYPLAMSAELMESFGRNIGAGYDISCGFSTTLWKSLLGPRALLQNFSCLVGAFHGHAHNRLCQLKFLATYVLGLGLEDLEGCERLFSKSNANAGPVRYASVFHRLQALTTYFEHFDTHETYANLSKFLVDNYWQALSILKTEPALHSAMTAAGIDNVDVFPARLQDEFKFLKSLMSEAEEDTVQMEYYQRLVNLADRTWVLLKRDLTTQEGSTATATARRHAQENYDKALLEVQQSESSMGVIDRWEPTGSEWAEAAHLVSTKRYRLALLKLERLVIQRMFELTKMNLSQTGYKLRKHIAKALQARSQAIKNALKTYNAAASSISPKGRALTWSEVVEYAFLADFDLLRDPEKVGEVREWATPAARLLLDQYFRIERAREEITRCNVEIRRLVTYIRDERALLVSVETDLQGTNPGLAWCVRRHRLQREQYNEIHMKRLSTFAMKAGTSFTGTLRPGVRVHKPSTATGQPEPMEDVVSSEANISREVLSRMEAVLVEDEERDIDDDVGERAEEEQLAEELYTVYMVGEDVV